MPQRLLYESHMHTPLCKHAIGEPEEYAQVAYDRGFKGITVTCHNPLPNNMSPEPRMDPSQWTQYLEMIARAKDAWLDRIDVRLGIEADYLPGLEPFLEKQLAADPFSHVLGSIHPQLPEYRQAYWHGDPASFHKTYFSHLAQAAETKLFDTLSHPDLVKNCTPTQWHLDDVIDHLKSCLDRIAQAGTAMELNTSGLLKAIPEFNPSQSILQEMCQRNIPCVIGADAHRPDRVGDQYRQALELLQAVGYQNVSFFLDRKRQDLPISQALASILQ